MAGSARRIVVEFLGEDKHLGSTLSEIEGKSHRFGSAMAKAGKFAAVGLAGGIAAATAAGVGFAKQAVEDQSSTEKLHDALKRTSGANDEQISKLENWISAVGRAKGVTDDDLRPALARLSTATHDVGKAQELTSLAMDVSAGTGKSLEQVSTALMKAQNGQVSSLSRLGINTKDAAGHTITMAEATQRMSDTFGGAAAQHADTLQGKMDRLKVIFSEAGESIGYKLIPMVSSMADWFMSKGLPAISAVGGYLEDHLKPVLKDIGDWINNTVVPAIKTFVGQMKDGTGPGGNFVDVLHKMRDALQHAWDILHPLLTFMANNKTVVATFAGVILTVVAAYKVWVGVQTALNVVMSANPIGLVVLAIAALAAGVVYAYKHSETFREGVKAIGGVLSDVAGIMSSFAKAVTNKVGDALGIIKGIPGKVKGAIGDLGHLLWDAGSSIIQGLIDGITSKISALTDKLHAITNLIPLHKGPLDKDKILLKPAGVALMDGLIAGIDQGKVKLQTVLDKLTDYIKKHRDKLSNLLSQKQGIVDAFGGFRSSIFSTDVSQQEGQPPASVQTLLNAGAAGKAQAQQLLSDVRTLISKGISSDLLTQLQGAGQSGEDQIHLLAGATADQIKQANDDNAATMKALQEAGLAAAKAQGLDDAIKQQERDIKLADTIRDKLDDLLKEQDKNTIVELHIDGHIIRATLLKLKRQSGQDLGLA